MLYLKRNSGIKTIWFLLALLAVIVALNHCKNNNLRKFPKKIHKTVTMLNDRAAALKYDSTATSLALARKAKILEEKYNLVTQEIRSNNILSYDYYRIGLADSVKRLSKIALESAKKINDTTGIGISLRYHANWGLMTGNYNFALNLLKQSVCIFKENKDYRNEAVSLNNIGIVFEYTADLDSSIYYYKKAAAINGRMGINDNLGYNYLGIGNMYEQFGNPDSALYYFHIASEIFDKYGNEQGKAEMALTIADVYIDQSQYFKADEKCKEALKFFSVTHNDFKVGSCYQRLGIISKQLGEYADAIANYEKSFHIFSKTNDRNALSVILSNMGNIYYLWGKYDESLEYYQKALKMSKSKNGSRAFANYYNNMGMAYYKKGNDTLAVSCFRKAYHEALHSHQQSELSVALEHLGLLEARKGNKPRALEYFMSSNKIDTKMKNFRGQASGLADIAKLYVPGQPKKAIYYFKQAFAVATKYQLKAICADIAMQLSDIYAAKKDYRNSYLFFSAYDSLNSIIFREKVANATAKFEAKYEMYKNRQSIKQLQLENNLSLLEVKKEKNLKMSYLIGFLLTAVFAFVLYRQFSRLKQSYKQLVKKSRELDQKENQSVVLNTNHKYNPVSAGNNTQEKISRVFLEKYSGSNITFQKENEIIHVLESKMKMGKIFLDQELSLMKLAKMLNTNSAYLSQIINHFYGLNFNNYINEYRIKEARVLLGDRSKMNYTIEGIAQSVGFKSKSAFNSAFKKFTGVTPSFFKNSVLKNDL